MAWRSRSMWRTCVVLPNRRPQLSGWAMCKCWNAHVQNGHARARYPARKRSRANGQGRDRSPETKQQRFASNVLLSVRMKAVLAKRAHQHNVLASVHINTTCWQSLHVNTTCWQACTYRHQHQATRLSLAANNFRMLLSYLDEAHANLRLACASSPPTFDPAHSLLTMPSERRTRASARQRRAGV